LQSAAQKSCLSPAANWDALKRAPTTSGQLFRVQLYD
jgi:hypothetical protein